MPENETEVSFKIQLKEAERKGRKEGVAEILAALATAYSGQLSRYSYDPNHSQSHHVRLNAAMVNSVKENQVELVLSCLEAGANIDACNKADHSMLYVAVEEGHTEMVKALLEAGADPNFSGENEYKTPLACAGKRGHTEIALALLAGGADVHQGFTPEESHWLINYAAEGDQVELTRAFIKSGARIHPGRHDNFWTPLMSAAMNGKKESAAVLIKAGSDVNAEYAHGQTALMLAAGGVKEGALDTVRLLLKAGAEVNSIDEIGRTALIRAAHFGRSETVRLLLSAGADVFSRAQSIQPIYGRLSIDREEAGNAFDVAKDDAIKEIIKSEKHRRIAAALSVLPVMPVDVRRKIVQLYVEEPVTDEDDPEENQ